jgi:hypothetical protein
MSPKRRTLWGTPGVRVSAGQQHIASRPIVKQDFAHFHEIFRSLSAVGSAKAESEITRTAVAFDSPAPQGLVI